MSNVTLILCNNNNKMFYTFSQKQTSGQINLYFPQILNNFDITIVFNTRITILIKPDVTSKSFKKNLHAKKYNAKFPYFCKKYLFKTFIQFGQLLIRTKHEVVQKVSKKNKQKLKEEDKLTILLELLVATIKGIYKFKSIPYSSSLTE